MHSERERVVSQTPGHVHFTGRQESRVMNENSSEISRIVHVTPAVADSHRECRRDLCSCPQLHLHVHTTCCLAYLSAVA